MRSRGRFNLNAKSWQWAEGNWQTSIGAHASKDLSFSRIFALHEQWKLEARFKAFNAINHTNFNNPGASISSSTFGRITSAGDPRILPLAMKLHF